MGLVLPCWVWYCLVGFGIATWGLVLPCGVWYCGAGSGAAALGWVSPQRLPTAVVSLLQPMDFRHFPFESFELQIEVRVSRTRLDMENRFPTCISEYAHAAVLGEVCW